jgi:RecA-family ATPase
MKLPIDLVIDALTDNGCEPKKYGDGYKSLCPAHDDHKPSLSISVGKDNQVLMKCFSGCTCKQICTALNLRESDLFVKATGNAELTSTSPNIKKPKKKKTYATVELAIQNYSFTLGTHSASWNYRNAENQIVGMIVRWNLADGGKEIRPISRLPDSSGWVCEGMPKPWPLYELPTLLTLPKPTLVFVVEGEKAADAAITFGYTATTSPHGASNAASADWSPLAGHDVVIFPDHDDAGEKYAIEVSQLAKVAGAKSVKIVRLVELCKELPAKGDFDDLLTLREKDRAVLREELDALVATTAEAVEQAESEDSDFEFGFIKASDLSRTFPNLRRPIIHGLLRSGETMNIISAPKIGKSWLVTELAMNASIGKLWLGYACAKCKVLLIDNELHGETLTNRVILVSNGIGINQSTLFDLTIKSMRGTLMDFKKLGEMYFNKMKKGQFDMVILDAFYRFLPPGISENDNGAMANIYNMIDGWAQKLDCCFVMIHHTSKGNQSEKDITDVGAGAGSMSRAADTHLILRKHQEDKHVVLEAETRSFAKIEPKVLNWVFPRFIEATEMDPKQLKNPRVRNDGWTTERFVKEVFGLRSLTPQEIKCEGKKLRLTDHRIKTLRQDAVAEGLLNKTGSTTATKYVPAKLASSETAEVLPSKDNPPKMESASALEG